jgi:hypothetical protein
MVIYARFFMQLNTLEHRVGIYVIRYTAYKSGMLFTVGRISGLERNNLKF